VCRTDRRTSCDMALCIKRAVKMKERKDKSGAGAGRGTGGKMPLIFSISVDALASWMMTLIFTRQSGARC